MEATTPFKDTIVSEINQSPKQQQNKNKNYVISLRVAKNHKTESMLVFRGLAKGEDREILAT